IGQFSNTADLKGGGQGEEIKEFADARAKGEKHRSDNADKQPSYRIEDKSGTVIEAVGLFSNKKVSAEQIARSKEPKPDTAKLDAAAKALADRQAAADKATQDYLANKAKYEK